jgi:hypothetical protein
VRVIRLAPLDRDAMRRISPLPPPEEVFADWLMSLPHDADLVLAAREQVRLIDRRRLRHPDLLCLRALLSAVAGSGWTAMPPNL